MKRFIEGETRTQVEERIHLAINYRHAWYQLEKVPHNTGWRLQVMLRPWA